MPGYPSYSFDEDPEMHPWQWVVTVIFIITLIVLGYHLFTQPKESEEDFCKRAGEWSISSLPTKCIPYYLNPDERIIYLETINKNK